MKLDNLTHNKLIGHLCGGLDICTELLCRFVSFMSNCIKSQNVCMRVANELATVSQSTVGHNIRILLSYLGTANLDSVLADKHATKRYIYNKWLGMCAREDICISHVILELIAHRDGQIGLPITHFESAQLLTQLCCG